MSLATAAIAIGGGLLGLATKSALAKPKQVQPLRPVTTNEARLRSDERDRVATRTGTNANKRVDFGAGEAFTGPKKSLLGRG